MRHTRDPRLRAEDLNDFIRNPAMPVKVRSEAFPACTTKRHDMRLIQRTAITVSEHSTVNASFFPRCHVSTQRRQAPDVETLRTGSLRKCLLTRRGSSHRAEDDDNPTWIQMLSNVKALRASIQSPCLQHQHANISQRTALAASHLKISIDILFQSQAASCTPH